MFYTRSNTPETISAAAGDRIQTKYQKAVDDKGRPVLVEVGTIDLQEHIQSFAQEVDINRIVSRAVNGDPSVLQRVQGVYADISGLPSNVHELQTFYKDAEEAFSKLDPALTHGMSFSEFMQNDEGLALLMADLAKDQQDGSNQICAESTKTEVNNEV